MSLWGPTRLIIRPVQPYVRLAAGGIDQTTVRTIEIVEITDCHGR